MGRDICKREMGDGRCLLARRGQLVDHWLSQQHGSIALAKIAVQHLTSSGCLPLAYFWQLSSSLTANLDQHPTLFSGEIAQSPFVEPQI